MRKQWVLLLNPLTSGRPLPWAESQRGYETAGRNLGKPCDIPQSSCFHSPHGLFICAGQEQMYQTTAGQICGHVGPPHEDSDDTLVMPDIHLEHGFL